MAGECDESSVDSGSFLSDEIYTDGHSDVYDSDGDILPSVSAQADAVVEAYQFEPTLTDSDSEADKDSLRVEAVLPERLGNTSWYG